MHAIGRQRGLEPRLLLLLWELADRYGRVGPGGVELDLRLTQEMLGDLAGARRPAVSTALGRLERSNRLSRSGGRWLLLGGPPTDRELESGGARSVPGGST